MQYQCFVTNRSKVLIINTGSNEYYFAVFKSKDRIRPTPKMIHFVTQTLPAQGKAPHFTECLLQA